MTDLRAVRDKLYDEAVTAIQACIHAYLPNDASDDLQQYACELAEEFDQALTDALERLEARAT